MPLATRTAVCSVYAIPHWIEDALYACVAAEGAWVTINTSGYSFTSSCLNKAVLWGRGVERGYWGIWPGAVSSLKFNKAGYMANKSLAGGQGQVCRWAEAMFGGGVIMWLGRGSNAQKSCFWAGTVMLRNHALVESLSKRLKTLKK